MSPVRSSRTRIFGTTILAALLLVLVFISRVDAGPVTNSSPAGSPPYIKLGIYKKVLSIVSSTGPAMEFGNNGQDIAATGDIIFRPSTGGSVATDGLRLVKNGATADLYIPGDLCLYDHANGLAQDCRHVWPTTSASSLWESGSGTTPFGTPYQFIKPKDVAGTTPGVTFTQNFSVTDSGFGYNAGVLAKNINNAGPAALFSSGDLVSKGQAFIYNQLRVNNREVWHAQWSTYRKTGTASCQFGGPGSNDGANCTADDDCTAGDWGPGACMADYQDLYSRNEGVNSRLSTESFGLDADTIMGNQATIEPPSNCTGAGFSDVPLYDSTKPRIACLCFFTRFQFNFNGFDFNPGLDPAPAKRCTPLANFY